MKTSFFGINAILSGGKTITLELKTNNIKCSWLIVTGATISAVKYSYIKNQNVPITRDSMIIKGIGGNLESIGYVKLKIQIG